MTSTGTLQFNSGTNNVGSIMISTGRLQFNSATNNLELGQTPQLKGHGPQEDCPQFRLTGYKSRDIHDPPQIW